MMNINQIIHEELQDITGIMSNIPDGYEHGILDETYESIKSIKKLGNDILTLVAEYNYDNFIENEAFSMIYGIELNTVTGDYGDLNQFIHKSNLSISFEETDSPNSKGEYTSYKTKNKTNFDPSERRNITVYFNKIVRDKIDEEIKTNSLTAMSVYFILVKYTFSTLIHELQHFHDDFRSRNSYSKNKANYDYEKKQIFTKNEVKDMYQHVLSYNYDPKEYNVIADLVNGDLDLLKNGEEIPNKKKVVGNLYSLYYYTGVILDPITAITYLRLQHEVNARFTQAIDKTTYYTADFINGKVTFIMKPMHDVIKEFTGNFYMYKALLEDQRKSLIRKVAQFWYFEEEKVNKLNARQIR